MTLPLPSSPHWPPTRMITIVLPALSCGLFGSGFGPPRLQVVEAGVVAAELELDGAGGAVAVLGDMDLGDAGLLVGFVVLGPEQEHDNVGVLLYRIVDYNITGNEIVQIIDRQVVNLLDCVCVNGANPIPVHVAVRQQFQLTCLRDGGKPSCTFSAQ